MEQMVCAVDFRVPNAMKHIGTWLIALALCGVVDSRQLIIATRVT